MQKIRGFVAMFFGGPAAAAVFYGLALVEWFVRQLFNLRVLPLDRAELIAYATWPLLGPIFAVGINLVIAILAVLFARWWSVRRNVLATGLAFTLYLIGASVLARLTSRGPQPEGLAVFFAAMALYGIPASVITVVNSLVSGSANSNRLTFG